MQRTDLLELKASARTAYAEMGFHTYYWDVVWLAFGAKEAGAALGKGIHGHLFHASGIPTRVFELGDFAGVVLQIEGEARPFCDWVESDCEALARPLPE